MKRMGVENLFDNANFSGAFESKNLLNTIILHKAKIEIDEEGSTAVAATMSEGWEIDLSVDFNCNHPFMFVIYDQKFNEILFAGIYRGPKK